MADEYEIDVRLVAVLNEVLDTVYQAKQGGLVSLHSPAGDACLA